MSKKISTQKAAAVKTTRKRRTQKAGGARKSAETSGAARGKASPEEAAFTRSLIAHGQAARVPPGGKLPAGATHELVTDENGEVRAVRRRFSII